MGRLKVNPATGGKNGKFFITILFISSLILSFQPLFVNGQISPVSTSTATLGVISEDKDIKTFKEKIATKVAQLQQKNNKAISGYVTEINDNRLKIKTENDQIYEIKLDQLLTKYYQIKGDKQSEIKLSDIKKDDYIIISGVQDDKTINANFIFIDESFAVLSGRVIEVNKENYTLKVLTSEHETYLLEVEVTTKQEIINIKTLQIERGGFSKIKEGDIAHFVIKKTVQGDKENRYSAQKILIIPQEYFIK